MSHLSTYTNNALGNVKEDLLCKSFGEIGLALDFNNKKITTDRWAWREQEVDAVFMQGTTVLPIGVKFEDNGDGTQSCKVVGDFYGTGLNEREVNDKIAQYYTKNHIINECEKQGWSIDESTLTTNEEGQIVFEVSRYA